MKTHRIVCLSLVIFAALRAGASAATYDLAACVERGLRANPGIASRKIAIAESEKDISSAISRFLPTVTAAHQISTLSNHGSFADSVNYPDQNGTVASLRLSQPLFTGFAGLTTLEKARYVRELRQTELREARVGLIRDIQRQFFEYLRLVAEVETAEVTVAGLEKQLKSANAFYEQRMAPQLQVLQAEVRVSSARQELVLAQTKAENGRRRLNELLAFAPNDSDIEYSGRLADFDYQGGQPLADYSARALSRPDLRMGELNIALARKDAKLALSRALPRVSVDADYNDRQRDNTNPLHSDYNEDYWTLGLNMSMNVFQGGADVADYRKQVLVANRYEEDLRKLRNQIDREVLVAYASQQEALLRIDSARKIKDVAEAALDRAQTAFELGLGTTTVVLDAQEELTRAMSGISRAQADFMGFKADLDYLAARDEAYAADDQSTSKTQ